MNKIEIGTVLNSLTLESIEGEAVNIPHEKMFTHLQFRRFSGCPMCNLHIHKFIQNNHLLVSNGVQEVAIFHSTKTSMLSHHSSAPFPLVADPEKLHYKQFGVEKSIMSILHPLAWVAGIKGLFTRGIGLPDLGETIIGLPADFFIDNTGKVVALKYGQHAYDQWELEEVIKLAEYATKT